VGNFSEQVWGVSDERHHRRMRARKRQDRGAGARSRTVLVSETTLAIELPGNDDLVVRRTTT